MNPIECPNGCDSDPDPWGQCRDCIKRIERERVLKLIEKAALCYGVHYAHSAEIRSAIARIRKGEL